MEQLVNSIAGFDQWTHAEKIRFFAWSLHSKDRKERFSVSDLRSRYEALNLSQPGNIHQLVAQLVQQRDLLKDSNGYRLEKGVRDSYEERYGQRPITVQVDKLLAELPAKVPDLAERAFLDEAIRCLRCGAFRAAIVMTWNLTFDHFCLFILKNHLAAFNAQWPLSFSKEHQKATIQAIGKREEFAELKESQVIQICRSAGIITGDIAKVLTEKLAKRNSAAHPSDVVVTQVQAEAFVDDLVRNVVLRFT
ncbi:hypothetical protein [Hyalangium versicolor]|uniref:hypothetical protein n=1 Tax=Hyalangium versicolor TaxID=2861190 RepID=UPI001CCC63D3|nr:hypothetical protein [Hyalangium versicolor]